MHKGTVDFAELHAPYTHQELILRAALGLGEDVAINPSGGALARASADGRGPDPDRRSARSGSWRGDGDRAVAHATQGPCLQQNLVCVLEGE